MSTARSISTVVAAAAAALALTACAQRVPPCEQLPAPTTAEQQAAREGAEVEREVGQPPAECVVVGDRWVDQTDE